MKYIHSLLVLLMGSVWACSSPGNTIDTDLTKPQEGVVKGRVVDAQGKPVANAEIVASSTDFHNATSTGYTDATGNYSFRVPTGIAAGSYSASGTVTIKYHGKNYKMALYESDTRVFSAYDGAVRNFVFRLTGKRTVDADESDKPLGATLEVHHQVDNVVFDHLEITLEPVGPLVDGSTGQKITTMMPAHGYYISDIPLGQYKITARDKVTGEQLGVSIQGTYKDYEPTVTGLFQDTDFIGSTHFDMVLFVNTL